MSTRKKILYHYTSVQTLRAIVNGISKDELFLKASNAKNMNDPNDCYYFIDNLNMIGFSNKETMDKLSEEKSIFDAPYLVSLTEHKDDLHMWNCYGDDGKGISIGFNQDALYQAANSFFCKNHISTHLYKCIYNSRKQIKKYLQKVDNNPNVNTYNGKMEISDFANIVKHPCYRYEREYRIVIKHGKYEPIINNVYNAQEDSFYFNIPISALKKIVVGPSANYDAVKRVFSKFFSKNTKFIRSIIPYRSK